ncbi:histidine kinase, partial [Bacteroides ovatus]
YKAQINPHFLFNTLNALYGLVLTKSDKTESAFIKFSNILKYMYAQTTSDLISISNEVEYIRQYVDLQSLRLNKHTKVVFETEMDDEQIQIPPMILITFVENSFKYGVSSDTDCTIFIRIIVKEGQLIFETENMIMKENHQNPHAIGIDNCRKRLELLYPNRFVLLTKEENGYFKTYLNIQLR